MQATFLLGAIACSASDPTEGIAASESPPTPETQSERRGARPGGALTLGVGPHPSFVTAPSSLDDAGKAAFYTGKALATQPWVRAPTQTDARDGLGPLYHARSCLACHVKGGRGQASDADGATFASLVRLSRPGRGAHGEPIPDPVYGAQLQPQATSLQHQLRGHAGVSEIGGDDVVAEADVQVVWVPRPFVYPDGEEISLRSPELRLSSFGYGPMHEDTRATLRHTPSLAGMGLLEQISHEHVEALADPDDDDGDGISGRVNRVWDPEASAMRPGRFGLKANQPSVRVQVAAALQGDMGLSSPVFPMQPCTPRQPRCLAVPNGNDEDGFEVPESLLIAMVSFTQSIGVPERRRPDHPTVLRGQGLFDEVGCGACHTPHFTTAPDPRRPHLGSQDIWPYTDLLLHDMGADLADGREDFEASGREWRTPPLWGAGLARAMHARVGFLHDGRARTIEEAIVWHDGEARASRDRFAELDAERRRALIAFVRSL